MHITFNLISNPNKPKLEDLLQKWKVDIHCHILPGIDDGAQDIETSINLIQMMGCSNLEQQIATPHVMTNIWENTPETIQNSYASLPKSLFKNQKKYTIFTAAEYMMDASFLNYLSKYPLLTLNDTHVLVEMSYVNPPLKLHEILYEIQLLGYVPVLAHPERYLFYYNNWNMYEMLKKMGCLFQINLPSLTGYYGTLVSKNAEGLLSRGMIDLVGSDVHHIKHIEALKGKLHIKSWKEVELAILQTNQLFLKQEV